MIGFYLMSEKGYRVISDLISRGYKKEISYVVAARDKQLQKDFFDEISSACISNAIPFYERGTEVTEAAQYTIAIAWRWLIPATGQLIVLHDSLLPRYRGFAPLVNCLINGEKETGVTALFAKDEYDTGDVIAQRSLLLHYPVKIAEVVERISPLYSEIVIEIMEAIKKKALLSAIPQDHSAASYSLWRDEEDYRINWNIEAGTVKRFIDAVGYPYKGATTLVDGRRARIREAQVLDDVHIENRTAGKVIFMKNEMPVVVCGKGLLWITEMSWDNEGTNALPLKKFRARFQ